MKNKYSNRFYISGGVLFLLFIAVFSFQAILAFSSSNIGNVPASIENRYGYGEDLRGWINISLNNEQINSSFFLFNPSNLIGNTTLGELIDSNIELIRGEDYNCVPSDCSSDYSSLDAGGTSKNFTLNSGESKIAGLKIVSNSADDFTNFKMSLNSSSQESCENQLEIDVLNDDIVEWQNSRAANSYCGNRNYGCYDNARGNPMNAYMANDEDYCEIIETEKAPGIKLGARIIKDSSTAGEAVFEFSTDESSDTCEINVNSSGEFSCELNMSIEEQTNLTVCLRKISGTGNYKLYTESEGRVCGFFRTYDYDFSIFVQKKNYANIGIISLNSSGEDDFDFIIDDYVYTRYGNNCSSGCYIPLKITSKTNNQRIDLNNLEINYNGIQSTNLIYLLRAEPAKIFMPFNKLFLNNAGLKVPSAAGIYNITLKLNNVEIIRKQIEVLSLPIIQQVYPLNVPAGANILFRAIVSGRNITGYTWNFGDNSTDVIQETANPEANHKYPSLGRYTLTLSARNIFGGINKSFEINAVNPKTYLNQSFADYLNRTNNLRQQINNFSAGAKNALNSRLNLTEIELKIAGLKSRFNSIENDSVIEYISLMNELSSINLPDRIARTEKAPGIFIINSEIINLDKIKLLLNEGNLSLNEDKLKNAVLAWFLSSLDVNSDVEVFSFIYRNESIPSLSYIKFNIKPKTELNKTYFIINVPSDSVRIQSGAGGEKTPIGNDATGFFADFAGGSSEKNIEIAVYSRVGFSNMPVYLFPSMSELSLIEIGECNNNRICEGENGEDMENCPNDCKSKTPLIIGLIIVFVIFLIVYIALQEWYKRRYENYLFKDKNELYNLIYFISNAEKKGLAKGDIFNKLRNNGWNNEQTSFAFKRFHGKRTGMWEIPIFKFFEKRKVNEEINNRSWKGMQTDVNYPPRPKKPLLNPAQIPKLINQPVQRNQMQQKPVQNTPQAGQQKIIPKQPSQMQQKTQQQASIPKQQQQQAQQKQNPGNQNINKPKSS